MAMNNILYNNRQNGRTRILYYRLLHERNLEIIFIILFFFFVRVVRRHRRLLPPITRWTLDAKSLGHGLTRSRCVHVRPAVSNCQMTAATVLLCSKPRDGSLPAPGKCMTGKNDAYFWRMILMEWIKKKTSSHTILNIFMHHVHNNDMRKP